MSSFLGHARSVFVAFATVAPVVVQQVVLSAKNNFNKSESGVSTRRNADGQHADFSRFPAWVNESPDVGL